MMGKSSTPTKPPEVIIPVKSPRFVLKYYEIIARLGTKSRPDPVLITRPWTRNIW